MKATYAVKCELWFVWEHRSFLERGNKEVAWLGIIVMMDITTSMHWCTWSNSLGGVGGKREKAEQKQLKHSVNVELTCFLRQVFSALPFSEPGRQVSWVWEQNLQKEHWQLGMPGKGTGQVIDVAVCWVQLMECKHNSLGVQGPQKQLLHLFLWGRGQMLLRKSLHLLLLGEGWFGCNILRENKLYNVFFLCWYRFYWYLVPFLDVRVASGSIRPSFQMNLK